MLGENEFTISLQCIGEKQSEAVFNSLCVHRGAPTRLCRRGRASHEDAAGPSYSFHSVFMTIQCSPLRQPRYRLAAANIGTLDYIPAIHYFTSTTFIFESLFHDRRSQCLYFTNGCLFLVNGNQHVFISLVISFSMSLFHEWK